MGEEEGIGGEMGRDKGELRSRGGGKGMSE